jgi:hypothetical protein
VSTPLPAPSKPKVVDRKPEVAPEKIAVKPAATTSVAKSPSLTPVTDVPGSPVDKSKSLPDENHSQTETVPAGIAIETQRAKLVKSGDELRQLRELTPEEKSRRRAFRSLMFMAAGIVLLTVLMALLLKLR